MHLTEDDHTTELEDRVKFLSYHQSITASTYDSAESIATPPEGDLDHEELRTLLARPLYLQERGASAERSQVYHPERENLMSSSSEDPTSVGTGRLVARGEERIGSTTPMPMTARRPSTMNSFSPTESPHNSQAVQQRRQISELQFDKFPTHSSVSCWKIRFKNQVTTCSDFHSEAMLGSKKWRWSIQWMN